MERLKRIADTKLWNEKYLFVAVLVANLIPVFAVEVIHTLDGPSHSYNAEIIRALWLDNPVISTHFQITPQLYSNWLSHWMLALLGSIFPAWVTIKIIFLGILIGLPLAFRKFIKTIRPKQIWMCLWIFPFTYSFPLMMGFYNFCLALIPFFLLLSYWVEHQNNLFQKRILIRLFLGLVITYYAHLLVFVVLMTVLIVEIVVSWIHQWMSSKVSKKDAFSLLKSKIVALTIVGIIPSLLTMKYLLSREPGYQSFLPSDTLQQWLFDIKPLIAFNPEIEAPLNNSLFVVMAVMWLFVMIRRTLFSMSSQFTRKQKLKHFFGQPYDFLGWSAIALILLYFVLPDTTRNAGYLSLRLALFAFLMMLTWIASQSFLRFIGIICTALGLYIHMNQLIFYGGVWHDFDEITTEIVESGRKLPPNQVILPISYLDNWLYTHASSYLGSEQPQVILKNYEAETGYFPVMWKDTVPQSELDAYFDSHTFTQRRTSNHLPDSIDWVFVLGRNVNFDHPVLDTLYHRANRQERNIIFPYGILIPAK